jgi:hypothetical protein
MRGIFAIDPGVSTGVAWAVLDNTMLLAVDAFQHRMNDGSTTITGTEVEQAKELFDLWQGFKQICVRQFMEPAWVDLVVEDFILLPGAHAGGKDGVAPARVAWAFEGYRQGRCDRWRTQKHKTEIIWQPPAAMKYEAQLKKWGVWTRGRQHERSAWCHVGLRLMRVMR